VERPLRDTVRRYWRGDEAQVAELAYRLSGSSDLYQDDGRRPYASINFITAHDGFTLRDLVSYNEKHNHANGERNADGESHNNSWNCGAEGPSGDPAIRELRARQQRNLLATLLLSQGVPMLLAGDERNRTQHGNNNAYCQDNPLSWLDWRLDAEAGALLDWTRRLVALRHEHPVLHRRNFFQGRRIYGQDINDIEWYRPDGWEMSADEWQHTSVHSLGMLLNGRCMDERDSDGAPLEDDVLLLLLNADRVDLDWTLPGAADGPAWTVLLDTARPAGGAERIAPGHAYPLTARSLALLCQPPAAAAPPPSRARESAQAAAAVQPPAAMLEARRMEAHTMVGSIVVLAHIWSPQLGNARDISVYLPPGYDEGDRAYPVLYMHDGQNLFDRMTSVGEEWQVDETMERLSQHSLEAIIVGIPNMGRNRIDEYSPYVDEGRGGGLGDAYLAFVAETLKPMIDSRYRTCVQREYTGVIGSSMGGLISLYAMLRYPEVFGFVAALSPSLWFAERALLKDFAGAPPRLGRIYLDVGTTEGGTCVPDARELGEILLAQGYELERDLWYHEIHEATHDERAWATRIGPLIALFLRTIPALD
jgi:isoamylase